MTATLRGRKTASRLLLESISPPLNDGCGAGLFRVDRQMSYLRMSSRCYHRPGVLTNNFPVSETTALVHLP